MKAHSKCNSFFKHVLTLFHYTFSNKILDAKKNINGLYSELYYQFASGDFKRINIFSKNSKKIAVI